MILRERLTLVLLFLLPFHAFGVTVLTRMIAGSDRAPFPFLVLWKELLLVTLLGIVFWERRSSWKQDIQQPDAIDWCIVGFIALSLPVTLLAHGDWKLYLFGFKYDFLPLVAFLVLRRVPWSEQFLHIVWKGMLYLGLAIAAYGLFTLLLPYEFFQKIGYGDFHSLYLPGSPLAPFQLIGETGIRRVQATMSGPNQLGLWLLFPWSLSLLTVIRREQMHRWISVSVFMLLSIVLLLTYSRAAWLATLAIGTIVLVRALPPVRLSTTLVRAGGALAVVLIAGALFAPSVVLRSSSSLEHIRRPVEALAMMLAYPLGRGIGSAGPASNRVSDACVHLPVNGDASWAADRPELCVFLGVEQVQPVNRACACPFLPENWYLQIGVELGWIGFGLFSILIVLVLLRLWRAAQNILVAEALFIAFLGVSIAALVLHAWESSAVALTLWLLAAVVIPRRLASHPPEVPIPSL